MSNKVKEFSIKMKFKFASFFKKKKEPTIKIGILYVCTGKYHIFWDAFYKSANKYFCKNSEVHYFVFTEYPIKTYGNKFVHHIIQPKLGWPYDTLKRFHLFLGQKDVLAQMDYLFFFNANMVFKNRVSEEVFLTLVNTNGLLSVLHSSFYDYKRIPPFEDNKESVAFVESKIGMNYFQGCLSGGTVKAYLQMAAEIVEMIDKDLKKSIIGKWWDESYMNKYFISHPPKALPPSFAYPQGGKLDMPIKIFMFEKGNYGGHDFLRH